MFITIDGDDIGQRITKYYLGNDAISLTELNQKMIETTRRMADYLEQLGFSIIFCGADGVAGHTETFSISENEIFEEISELGKECATFSAGTGDSLRESYVALMAAKSHGKAQLYSYRNLER
ncbi:mCpol domain-containing protein [Caballeronia novacaledonica]|uniref:mCpol domain-containing protein n=1 Tax=Caballeronia novacaledonica TaxID=1544861 RepID=UPI000D11DD66|nr:mCpol domain-containing protein [Caballeronia novacaledonica]